MASSWNVSWNDEFYNNLPHDCQLIGVEFPHAKARSLPDFAHPERAVYLLGENSPPCRIQARPLSLPVAWRLTVFRLNCAVLDDTRSTNSSIKLFLDSLVGQRTADPRTALACLHMSFSYRRPRLLLYLVGGRILVMKLRPPRVAP